MKAKLSNEVGFCRANGISTLTLRRAPVNVLNIAFMRELENALLDPETIADTAVLALRAEGKAFCAGVDVADHTPERTEEMLRVFHSLIVCLKELPVPTVAVVQGAALGGGFELALACDMIIASDRAKFALPEITLAVFPPVAMLELPPLIGMKKTAELIFSGKTITASEAERIGLLNEVYASELFEEKSAEFLSRFSNLSKSSLSLTKKTLLEASKYANQHDALKYVENSYLNTLMKTADANEGISAFMEKREPVWSQLSGKRT